MTREDISCLNYILGRFEGIAFAATGELQTGLLDTCELFAEKVNKFENEVYERENGER